ncbi:hypothetical protein [Microlunatus sp. Y2014]|uniref:hypothetical protein n=1 Tax=Microlunatus sp. Y2014 TaxID=3418488 RepID=UPI003DA72F96
MTRYDHYPLGWLPMEPDRDRSEKAHQRWLRRMAVRERRRTAQRPQQPRPRFS